MIVEVVLRITDDERRPALGAEACEVFVQQVPDFETNLLGSMALMKEMVGRAQERVEGQMRDYREMLARPESQQRPEGWRPPER